MKRVRMDEAARAVSTSPIMVGEVRVQPLTDGISEQIHVAVVAFRDGSHNIPHTHESEQVLIVLEGEGIVANDQEEFLVSAGDAVVIPAGESHWHGARPGTSMVHLAIMLKGH